MSWDKKFTNVQPPIGSAVLRSLNDAGIADMEQLQDRFYSDFDGSLRKAAESLHVQQDVLAGLIAKTLVASSEPLTTSWNRGRWADSLLALAFLYGVLTLLRPWLSWLLEKTPGGLPTFVSQVVATRAIPIYGMIREDGLGVTYAAPGAPTAQMTSRFVGRYALAAIPAGTAITESALSRNRSDISGQSILEIEIKRAPALDGRELPEDVDLVFSARQGGAAGVSLPGRLLALDTKATPPTAAVALPKEKVDEAAKWIGSSDVYLLLKAR
jgi:hypothetical protein